jgi:hypothetical protein
MKKNNLKNRQFYSLDVANSDQVFFKKKTKTIKRFMSVSKLHSHQVEAENFYRPISKYLKF